MHGSGGATTRNFTIATIAAGATGEHIVLSPINSIPVELYLCGTKRTRLNRRLKFIGRDFIIAIVAEVQVFAIGPETGSVTAYAGYLLTVYARSTIAAVGINMILFTIRIAIAYKPKRRGVAPEAGITICICIINRIASTN